LQNLTGPEWGPASNAAPRQLVVICHGHGGSGKDMIQFAPTLGAALPDALFVAPDAPGPCDLRPNAVRQWFSMQDRRSASVGAGVRLAAATLDAFLDGLMAEHGLPPEACAIGGFSQGAVISLFAGLRRAAAPRAIFCYSGALIDPASLGAEMANRAPVLLVHGMKDATVPPYVCRAAEAVLREAGVPVESHLLPELGHGIDAEAVALGAAFLRQAFAVDVAEP
jgi:phospholipase/carboxylesterase